MSVNDKYVAALRVRPTAWYLVNGELFALADESARVLRDAGYDVVALDR